MRTNIDINDKLMRDAMKATGAHTKREAVEVSLCRLIEVRARQAAQARIFRQQERERRKALREGRLDEWHAAVKKKGSVLEAADADQH